MSAQQESRAMQRARLTLVRAQLVAQIGNEKDFEAIITAQEAALREGRAENKRRLEQIDAALASLPEK